MLDEMTRHPQFAGAFLSAPCGCIKPGHLNTGTAFKAAVPDRLNLWSRFTFSTATLSLSCGAVLPFGKRADCRKILIGQSFLGEEQVRTLIKFRPV